MKKINKKVALIILNLIIFQCLFYFISKTFQGKPTILTSSFDSAIPFIPEYIYVYIFWYLLLFIVPYYLFLKNKETFVKYCLVYCITVIICNLIFIIFPTAIVRPNIIPSNFTEWITNIIFTMDTPIMNCLPSIHCALSVLFILSSFDTPKYSFKYRLMIMVISVLIMASTLFIKQHVIYDVIAAILVVLPIWILVSYSKLYKPLTKYIFKTKN